MLIYPPWAFNSHFDLREKGVEKKTVRILCSFYEIHIELTLGAHSNLEETGTVKGGRTETDFGRTNYK